MLGSYRRYFIAAAGSLIVACLSVGLSAWLYPNQVHLSGNTAVDSIPGPGDEERWECSPAQTKALPQKESVAKAIACKKAASDNQEQRNSYIQSRRSADASDAQAMYAFEQAKVAAIGAGLGLVTMLAAIGAAVYAAVAAHHTARSANISADTAERQLRAYMVLKHSGYDGLIKGKDEAKDLSPTYSVSFINAGQTPAFRFRSKYRCFVDNKDLMPETFSPERIDEKTSYIVGPGRENMVQYRKMNVTPHQRGGFLQGLAWVYIVGALECEDIYGNYYRVDYVARSRGPEYPRQMISLMERETALR